MKIQQTHRLIAASAVVVAWLAGCSGKPSAVIGQDRTPAAASGALASSDTGGGGAERTQDPRDLPVPKLNGKPMWAANRRHTAEENAAYQFTRNGADFAASSESEYVTKAHAFVDSPPADTEVLTRKNGDRLLYQAKQNVFAVVSRDGAPRTMFRPRDGAQYWEEQKQREQRRRDSLNRGGPDQS